MTSIVLAGGRGSRLGREKHGEVIAGKGLVERTIGRLSVLSSDILIVISGRQSRSLFTSLKARTVIDLFPDAGSLGGIYTGLVYARTHHSLVVACDMPFLNLDLLRYMIALAPEYDVVVPAVGSNVEPLHAIYSKNCLKPVESLLKQGNLRITAFYDQVRVRTVGGDEIDKFDPDHLSFFNVNTHADLEKARKLAIIERTSEVTG
ncbi:MAG: molybdenum cofactor guanylyltransferase [Dehalococcoidia bacterium]|nr:molybdenum cofactor guanylyltransferase [Dehalococcoidia bacterium]